jgi:1-acyl-sn-glycerol-3-phosphate acyltransferase
MPDPTADERQYGKLYPVARAILTPVFRAAWRIYLRGSEHVPEAGPAILCPNHTSVIDSFLLPSILPRRITYVGKAEYMDDWKTKHLFPAIGMIPIDRSGGDASQRALDAAAGVLERGELFGIYPEGTRSRDGWCRWAWWARATSSRRGRRRPAPSAPARSASAGPSRSSATATAATTGCCCARSPTS